MLKQRAASPGKGDAALVSFWLSGNQKLIFAPS